MKNTDSDEERTLLSEINLVCFDIPELIVNKTVPTPTKKVITYRQV